MKRVLVILICICMLFTTSCSMTDKINNNFAEAIDLSKKFCLCLETNDMEKAKEYLCPTYSTPMKDDLEKYITKLEIYNNIDFSQGVTITNSTQYGWWTSNTLYYGYDVYEIVLDMLIGEKEISLFFKIAQGEDDSMLGILSFGVNPS